MSLRNRAKRSRQENSKKKSRSWRPGDWPTPKGPWVCQWLPMAGGGLTSREKMSSWTLAVWWSLTLLFVCFPGCCLLRGPRSVKGTEGETLSLQFQYEEKYKTYSKYWCRRSKVLRLCENALKTKDSETEVSTGRASISDHPENLTFTVTLKDLLMEDAGSYWCGIHIPWTEGLDDSLLVEVSVFSSSSSKNFRSTLEPPTWGPPTSGPSTTRDDTLSPSPQPRSLQSSIYLLLLVFLELPLLLSMLSAVLWVNRPLRSPRQEADQTGL
ncbi:CMRF35-like molecule 6 isoform 2-T2 [Thomomys bottae]